MNSSSRIRLATELDSGGIADVAEATGLFPRDALPDMMADYLKGSEKDIWLTADGPDGVVGFAYCEPERMTVGTWNLLAIGVMPAHQSRGVGSGLVQHLEEHLRQANHRILLVETLGTDDYAQTRSFYVSKGFVEEARIREFYDAGGDKVVFWKHL